MDLLLRELYIAADQGQEFLDSELSGNEISIGSGQDQLIQLIGVDIEAAHAVLQGSAGNITVKCQRGNKVSINGNAVSSGSLNEGDILTLGGHTLSTIKAPHGFDLALELEPDRNVDASAYQRAYRTNLTDTWLSKRLPSWILITLVLVAGLLIPMLFMGEDSTAPVSTYLPTDALWTSGPLLPAHNVAMGDDCSACHVRPFERVQDKACLTCHTNISDHVVPHGGVSEQNSAVASVGRCASCHKEHNEPTYMVVDSDSLCTDCHSKPEELTGVNPHMQAVSGFSADEHPAFEVALLVPSQTERSSGNLFEWNTVEKALDQAVETSNLKFPHDLHLDVEKVRDTNDGSALGCGSCHTLASDREHFVPITMEQHCQDCHELTFDKSAPARQLPHGLPNEAIIAMEGHFMRVYSDPKKKQTNVVRRRLPGRSAEEFDCKGSAFDCAMQRTRDETLNQFSRRGCITCHRVVDLQSDDIYTRFQVHPVRLSHDFIPAARFDHRSHFTQKDADGDAACLTCHRALESVESAEIMIPDLDNCLSCHSDRNLADTVPLDCIACHAYHPLGQEPVSYLDRTL